MKAVESSKYYAARVRECSNFAVREIKKVCKEIGARPAGSEAEAAVQERIQTVMTPFADEVRRDSFNIKGSGVRPLMTAMPVLAVISTVILALSLFGVLPRAAGFGAAACDAVILALALYIFAAGKIYRASFAANGQSANVICVRRAAGEVKRRIILGGHADSSYEWRFARNVSATAALTAAAPALMTVAAAASQLFENNIADIVFTAVHGICIFMLIPQLFFVNTKASCPGAANGLTGVYAAMAAVKYLNDNDVRFENTEVAAVSLGGGFAGNAGACALSFGSDGAQTVFLSADTICDYDSMRASVDSDAVKLVQSAGEAMGCTVRRQAGKYDCPDAAAAQKKGVKSVYFTAVAPERAPLYRTCEDRAEKLDMKAFEAGLKLMLETVFMFDEQGV